MEGLARISAAASLFVYCALDDSDYLGDGDREYAGMALIEGSFPLLVALEVLLVWLCLTD
jgi:hypothetical protein